MSDQSQVKDKLEQGKERVKEMTDTAAEKGKEMVDKSRDTAEDGQGMGKDFVEKCKDAAGTVGESDLVQKASSAMSAAGEKISESMGFGDKK